MKKWLVCLLFVPAMARAEFETGNTLYTKMQDQSIGEKMYVMGYVTGVFDAHQHINHCLPAGVNVTIGQVTDIARMYLQNNPAIRHKTADVLLRDAFRNLWPCANRNNSGGTTRL
jgi:hypothetical protein